MSTHKNLAGSLSADDDVVKLTPNECVEFVIGAYQSGITRVPLFRGSPGLGKTGLLRQAADRLRSIYPDFECVVINPTMPADEVGGIPKLVETSDGDIVTKYALPDWFPTKSKNPNWRGIIVLDDALQGAGEMQKVLANLIHDRALRNEQLPDGAMIAITGNRTQDKAGVAKTLTHFADRMCWINVGTTAKTWIEDFAIPNRLAQEVVGYIMRYEDKLNMFDPMKEKCPTPRTWEAVSKWVVYLNNLQAFPGETEAAKSSRRNKLAHAILSGELGEGEAAEFWAFCDLFGKLPDVNDIFRNPLTYTTNFELDVQYALVLAIANKLDSNTLEPGLEYIDRIGPDLSTLAVQMAARRDRTLVTSKAFLNWTVRNQEVLHNI